MPRKSPRSSAPSTPAATAPPPRRDPALSPDENLEQILRFAAESRLQERLAMLPPPRTEALIELHRALAFQLLSQPNPDEEALKRVNLLMRPVLGWVALVEKRKLRELSERKYQNQVEAEKERERKQHLPEDERALSPETLEWVERQLDLF